MRRALSIIVLVGLLAGCASTDVFKGLRVSGESLKGVGQQFEAVSRLYKTGCDAKQIQATDCTKYRVFGQKFKQSYPLAISLWESARAAGDGAAEKKAREVIVALATELSTLAVLAYGVFGEVR